MVCRWLALVRSDYRQLANVPVQTSRRIKAALRQDWRALEFVQHQTVQWCVKALQMSPDAINLIRDRDLVRKILETGRFDAAIDRINEVATRQWLARSSMHILRVAPHLLDGQPDRLDVIRRCPELFYLVSDPTEDEWRAALRHGAELGPHTLPPALYAAALTANFRRFICHVPPECQTVELMGPISVARWHLDLIGNDATRNWLAARTIQCEYVYLTPDERRMFAMPQSVH